MSAPPILYLHGFASGPGSQKARFFRDRLSAAGRRVIIPDLTSGDFERSTITAQLAAVDRAARGGPVDLIGSSLGGWLASLCASRHANVRRLVLLAPAFGFNRRWPDRLGLQQMEEWRRKGVLEFYHYGERAMRPLRYTFIEDAAQYPDDPDFSQPALIFHGLYDDVVPAGASREFAAGRLNVRLELVEAGHDLLNVLDEIAPQVLDFLAG